MNRQQELLLLGRYIFDLKVFVDYLRDNFINENRLYFKSLELHIKETYNQYYKLKLKDKKTLKKIKRLETISKNKTTETIKSEQCSYFLKLMDSEEDFSYKKALILTYKKYKCNRYNLEKEIDIYF